MYIKDIFLYIDNKNNWPYWLMPVLLFPDQLESVFLTADKLKINTFQIFKWENISTDIGLKFCIDQTPVLTGKLSQYQLSSN